MFAGISGERVHSAPGKFSFISICVQTEQLDIGLQWITWPSDRPIALWIRPNLENQVLPSQERNHESRRIPDYMEMEDTEGIIGRELYTLFLFFSLCLLVVKVITKIPDAHHLHPSLCYIYIYIAGF